MPTLKQVNAHIQTKYPSLQLVKGNGYFYVASDDDAMGLKIAALYSTSIAVSKIGVLSLTDWMESVEHILRDGEQLNPYNRCPIIL